MIDEEVRKMNKRWGERVLEPRRVSEMGKYETCVCVCERVREREREREREG